MSDILSFSPAMPYIILVAGFVLLIKGADFFVDGCSSVARTLHIPSIIIGLTIVALGTSAPEAAVSITSSLKEANDMSVSNVIGSNFFNLLMVVGVCSLIKPLKVSSDIIKRDFPISLIVTLIMLLMATDCFSNGLNASLFSRIDGIILLIIFTCYIFLLIFNTLKRKNDGRDSSDDEEIKVLSAPVTIIYIIGGIVAIVSGGDFVVDSASEIARSFGLSNTLIGLTVVALGTSLPELVTSIVASVKGENDLALGNVVGSNLFNILFVLGIATLVSPIDLSVITNSIFTIYDIIILIAVSVLSYIFTLLKKDVSRTEGSCMVLMYICYMVYIITR